MIWESSRPSFTHLAPSSKALVPACRRQKTSHIVILFYGTRSIIMPHGIFGRPDVRPNSNKNIPPPTLLPLLRSLTSEELQSTKSSTSTIGIDGGKLDLN